MEVSSRPYAPADSVDHQIAAAAFVPVVASAPVAASAPVVASVPVVADTELIVETDSVIAGVPDHTIAEEHAVAAVVGSHRNLQSD